MPPTARSGRGGSRNGPAPPGRAFRACASRSRGGSRSSSRRGGAPRRSGLVVCASATSLTISSSRGVSSSSPAEPRSSTSLIRVRCASGVRNGSPRSTARTAASRSVSALRLQHVAGGTGLERLEQVALVVVHREDQNRDLGRLPLDLPGRLQPGQLRHFHVEDRQVRAHAHRQVARRGAVGGLGYHLDVGLALQGAAQAGPDDPVVVGDQDPHRHGSPARVSFTVVPGRGAARSSGPADQPRPLAHAGGPGRARRRRRRSRGRRRATSRATPSSGVRRSRTSLCAAVAGRR